MPELQENAARLLDSMQEAKAIVVITLYNKSKLASFSKGGRSRFQELLAVLTEEEFGINMSEDDAKYWLNWMGESEVESPPTIQRKLVITPKEAEDKLRAYHEKLLEKNQEARQRAMEKFTDQINYSIVHNGGVLRFNDSPYHYSESTGSMLSPFLKDPAFLQEALDAYSKNGWGCEYSIKDGYAFLVFGTRTHFKFYFYRKEEV